MIKNKNFLNVKILPEGNHIPSTVSGCISVAVALKSFNMPVTYFPNLFTIYNIRKDKGTIIFVA